MEVPRAPKLQERDFPIGPDGNDGDAPVVNSCRDNILEVLEGGEAANITHPQPGSGIKLESSTDKISE